VRISPNSTRADEVLLAHGRPGRDGPQLAGPRRRGAGPQHPEQPVEEGVHVADLEGRDVGRLTHDVGDPTPTDTDPPLPGPADQEPDRRRDLVGVQPPQQGREDLHLGQP